MKVRKHKHFLAIIFGGNEFEIASDCERFIVNKKNWKSCLPDVFEHKYELGFYLLIDRQINFIERKTAQ